MKHGQSFKTMAITINGNGTITGYEPVANGSITAAKLASGAISASTLPAGSIVQTVTQKVEGGSMTNVTGSSTFTGLYAEITPQLSNSKILVLANLRVYISGGGLDTGAAFTLQRKIGSGSYSTIESSADTVGNTQFYIYNPTSGSELSATHTDIAVDTPGTNSQVVRYQVFCSAQSGGTINLTSSTGNHYLTLMEIKQ